MELTTAKQVAQTFYLDDIVTHDLILDSYNTLEKELKERNISWEKTDIIYRIVQMVLSHPYTEVFNIQKHNVLKLIYDDYSSEIENLYTINQKK